MSSTFYMSIGRGEAPDDVLGLGVGCGRGELGWPFDVENAREVAASFARGLPARDDRNLVAMAAMVANATGGVPVDSEFGLDQILDGLERARDIAGH